MSPTTKHRQHRLTVFSVLIEILEDVVLDILRKARDWDPPFGTLEVANRAG